MRIYRLVCHLFHKSHMYKNIGMVCENRSDVRRWEVIGYLSMVLCPLPYIFWRTIILAERLERLSWSGTYSLKTWSLHYFLIVNAFYLVQEGLQQCTVAPRCILDVSLSHLQSAFVICLLRGPCTPVQFAESPLRYSIPPSLPSLRKPLWESLLTPLLAAAITIGSTSLAHPHHAKWALTCKPSRGSEILFSISGDSTGWATQQGNLVGREQFCHEATLKTFPWHGEDGVSTALFQLVQVSHTKGKKGWISCNADR